MDVNVQLDSMQHLLSLISNTKRLRYTYIKPLKKNHFSKVLLMYKYYVITAKSKNSKK